VTETAHSGKYGYDLTGTINIPAGETAALRITLKRERNAGFINQSDIIQREGDNYLNGLPVFAQPGNIATSPAVYFKKKDVNFDETTAARLSMLWEPTDTFKFSVSYNYAEMKGNGAAIDNYTYPGGQSPIDPRRTLDATGEYEISSSSLEPFERKTHQAALDASYDMGFATLAGTIAYGETKGSNSIDANRHILGIPFFQDYYAGVPANPRFVYGYQNTDADKQWTEELRLVSNGKDNKIDYVLGAYFQQQDRTLGLFSYNPGGGDFLTNTPYYTGVPIFVDADQSFLRQIATQKYKESAIYGNVTVHLTDKFQVTGGGRYFWETFDATTDQRRGPFQAIDPVASASRNKLSSQIFSVNASYELASNLTTYATWSQGFRRGGTSAFLIDPTLPFAESANLLTYEPDKTNNFELGLKGRLGGIYFSAAAFYIKWNNAQIDLLTPYFGYSAVVNATKASSKGIELEASGPLGDSGLSFNLGFAYAKARIDKAFALRAAVGQDPLTGISIFADDGINGLKGDRLPGSPDYSGTFTLKYDTDLSETTKLGFNVGADFRGSTVNDLTPTNGFTLISKTPSFMTFRAGANVDFDKFSVSLFVNNLLDKHVVYSKGVSNLFQQALGGYGDTYYVGRPREIGLRLGYRF
jgi:outer membrane receptor protein involved in Fe transport